MEFADYGRYTPHIVACYGATVVVIGGLIAYYRRRLNRALKADEKSGDVPSNRKS
ncbi:MAG: heme exporter protein CcmD [Pseudomonadota bacterium]